MKKQLLTGALTLSLFAATTGMAFAADAPLTEVGMSPVKIVNTAASDDLASFTNTKVADGNNLSADENAFKISDVKQHTADTYAAEIKEVKANFDKAVKAGRVTRAEADQTIAKMEEDLQQIKAGTLTINYADMLDKDGKSVGKVTFMNADKAGNGENSLGDIQLSTTTAGK